jgi:hypothetical protein
MRVLQIVAGSDVCLGVKKLRRLPRRAIETESGAVAPLSPLPRPWGLAVSVVAPKPPRSVWPFAFSPIER